MLTGIILQITKGGQAVADTASAMMGEAGQEPSEISISLLDLAMKGGGYLRYWPF
ncbi:MAG: hypothetical protein R2759_15005 [Bacteroidales bacterium]